jgi:hypothetical protein
MNKDNKFNLSYSPIGRRKKGVMATFGVIVAPFYRIAEVAPEGAPVVLDDANPGFVKVATPGEAENGILGLLAQEVYDPAVLGELANYEFHNNTKARKGDTVGVITAQGYVETINFDGEVNANDKLYPAAGGKLSATKTGNDMPVGVVDFIRDDGYALVRVNFDWFFDKSVDVEASNSSSDAEASNSSSDSSSSQ